MHTSPSSQALAAPGTQALPAHTSPILHTFPSEHTAELLTPVQPIAVSHTSSVQGLPSLQTANPPPTQVFSAQVSFCVQAFPSSQGNVLAACWHKVTPPQVSVVQAFPSSQLFAEPGMHTPPLHASFSVQLLPSEQGRVFFTNRHPLAVSQASSVHGLPSAHNRPVPPKHVPFLHISPLVHALPS